MDSHYVIYLANNESGKRLESLRAESDQEAKDIVNSLIDGTLEIEHRIEIVRTK